MALVVWPQQPIAPVRPKLTASLKDEPDIAIGAAEETKGPDTFWTLWAYLLIVVAAFVAWVLWKTIEPGEFTPTAGFSPFAPLYVFGQGIERLIEPFAKLLGATRTTSGNKATKQQAVKAREQAFAALANTSVDSERSATAAAAVTAQALVERIRRNTTIIAWGIASALGMLACGAFGVRLLAAVGFKVPVFWDITITGLAIGSGTKPLHDLISHLQKSKDGRANPPGVGATD